MSLAIIECMGIVDRLLSSEKSFNKITKQEGLVIPVIMRQAIHCLHKSKKEKNPNKPAMVVKYSHLVDAYTLNLTDLAFKILKEFLFTTTNLILYAKFFQTTLEDEFHLLVLDGYFKQLEKKFYHEHRFTGEILSMVTKTKLFEPENILKNCLITYKHSKPNVMAYNNMLEISWAITKLSFNWDKIITGFDNKNLFKEVKRQ